MKKLILSLCFCIVSLMILAQSPDLFQYQAVVRDGNGDIVPDQQVTFQISIISGSVSGTVEYAETHSLTTNEFGLAVLSVGNGVVVTGDIATIDWGSALHFMKVELDITGGTTYTDMGTVQLLSVPYALYAKNAANTFSGDYNDLSNQPDFTGWDTDALNDFSGNFGDLSNVPDLSGDVTGQITSNTVTGIQGMDISTNVPANGQVLKWNNTSQTWEPSDDQLGAAGTTDGVVTGAAITGTTTKTLTLIRSNGLGDITATFTDLVDDADADPANEIQSLTLSGNDLTISGGNTVTLPAGETYTAGSGIAINGSNEISNISPDQTVILTQGGATTITGTYPNFTISSTDNNTTYTAGSGININGSNEISNTSPDQPVTITPGTGINVTGTYPDFIIANTSPNQPVSLTGTGATTVTGTYPTFTINSTDNNTTYSAGTGLTLTGTEFTHNAHSGDVNGTTNLTVTGIQSRQVTSNIPSDGQILKWSTANNRWELSEDELGAAGTNDGVVTSIGVTGTATKTITLTRSQSLPDLTATFTDDGSVYTAGSGINITGSTISNTLPDQTVTLTQGGATTITGTYPNFTISSTDNNTTYTAGTGLTLSGSQFAHDTHSGDVTGTSALTVTGIRGKTVSSTAPTANQILKYNGTTWVPASDENTTYTAGSGLSLTGTTFANSAPDQPVTLTQGGAVTISGSYPSFTISSTDNNTTYTAGTGLTLTGTTFSLTAPVSAANGGTGQTTYTNGQLLIGNTTGNTLTKATLTAGTGVNISNGAGAITITNSLPDQTVSLTQGGATTITGTYPNFTISSTDNNTTYTAGSGISIDGSNEISNTSPDQTITLTQGGATTITGTYPNFTISSTDDNSGGTVTSIATGNGITGGTITTTGTLGLTGQALAMHNLSTNGLIARTGSGTVAARTITAGDGISITNGSGVSGNPTIAANFGTTSTTVAAGNHTHTAYGVAGTNGMVQFNDNGNFGASANLFWDNTNTRLGVGLNNPDGMMVVQQTATTPGTEALFEVKDKLGHTVFAVYEDSVKIFVNDDGSKANKGAFAVSGRNTAKSPTNEYLRVTPDSVRVFIDEDFSATGDTRGGFAVGGFSSAKSNPNLYMNIEGGNNPQVIDTSEARVLWYPAKEAFMAGKVLVQSVDSVGLNSWATGFESRSIGDYSQALGYRARAFGDHSTAIGNYANAASNSSFAMGDSAVARGYGSFAFGSRGLDTLTGAPTMMQTIADADYSFAFGFGAHAANIGSFAIGTEVNAQGVFSMAVGLYDTAYADHSYAFGLKSITRSKYAFAFGIYNESKGAGSFTFGSGNKTDGQGAFAFGTSSVATGDGAFAFGTEDTASFGSAFAIGYRTKASGLASMSCGSGSRASGIVSTAFGNNTTASGIMSTSFGTGTTASGMVSTAFGSGSTATANYATAFGFSSDATAAYATAMGNSTTASGINSLAIGQEIEANGDYSVAIALNDQNGTVVTADNVMSVMGGNLGIGTTTPARLLHVNSTTSGEPAARFRISADGTLLEFYSGFTMEGSISIAGLTTSYNAFTGSHYTSVNGIHEKGMLMRLNGNNSHLNNNNESEIIYGVEQSTEENAGDIIGAYLGKETFDKENSPHLVMAVGNGVMWVVDKGEDLKVGDYLISSSVEGHAMKDNGKYEVANIVARVAEPVEWKNVTTEINGVKHKLVSVFFENFKMYHYETRIENLEKQIEQINARLGESASK